MRRRQVLVSYVVVADFERMMRAADIAGCSRSSWLVAA